MSDQTIVHLKEWMLVNGKSEKKIVFKKYMLLKKFFFWKGSCSEEVTASKKYTFWIITYSGEKAPLKSSCAEKVFIFK